MFQRSFHFLDDLNLQLSHSLTHSTMGNTNSRGAALACECGMGDAPLFSFDESELPRGLRKSSKFLSPEQYYFCKILCDHGQEHIFDGWEYLEKDDRARVIEQLTTIDEELAFMGGLPKYLSKAKKILSPVNYNDKREGMPLMNPVLKGLIPTVPAVNKPMEIGTDEYNRLETLGLKEIGAVGFCIASLESADDLIDFPGKDFSLVSRLQLPTESLTKTSYLKSLIEQILALSKRYFDVQKTPWAKSQESTYHIGLLDAKSFDKEDATMNINSSGHKSLPLCIMTSKQTYEPIKKYLEENQYFGMDPGDVTLLCRKGDVPVFMDSDGAMALVPSDTQPLIQTQGFGHGDFHRLLFQSGTAKMWFKEYGLKWLYMMGHDTNPLGLASLPVLLGKSKESSLVMNTLTVPRRARDEALGGIAALKTKRNNYKTASLETGELDSLLRENHYNGGDVNDESTRYSLFPGNTNQIVFDLEEYLMVLEETNAVLPMSIDAIFDPEPIDDGNDKRHRFHSKHETQEGIRQKGKTYLLEEPEALQCRMQDFVHLLSSASLERVGITHITASSAFSPICYPSSDDYIQEMIAESKGDATTRCPLYLAATAEADLYRYNGLLLKALGCNIEFPEPTTLDNEVSTALGPFIVFKPNFGTLFSELKVKFPTPHNVRISDRSTLIIRGDNVVIHSLQLDGCLLIDCDDGKELQVKNVISRNKGWTIVKDENATDPVDKMRGFRFQLKDSESITEKVDQKQDEGCHIM